LIINGSVDTKMIQMILLRDHLLGYFTASTINEGLNMSMTSVGNLLCGTVTRQQLTASHSNALTKADSKSTTTVCTRT